MNINKKVHLFYTINNYNAKKTKTDNEMHCDVVSMRVKDKKVIDNCVTK